MSRRWVVRNASTGNRATAALLIVGLLVFLFSGCVPIRLVQPYDAKLFDDTEAFFKKADAMIEAGKLVSPRDDAARATIVSPGQHPGHFSAFESRYNDLLVDSDALILRAIANGQAADYLGSKIQERVNKVIDEALPSSCEDGTALLARSSLTAMNFVDLKCTVIRWKGQHDDKELTRGTSILKKANWDGRKITLFDAILAIQKAEGFKKTSSQ